MFQSWNLCITTNEMIKLLIGEQIMAVFDEFKRTEINEDIRYS